MNLRAVLRIAKYCELDLLDDAIALWWKYKVHPSRENSQLMRIVVYQGGLSYPALNLNDVDKKYVKQHLKSLLRMADLSASFTGLMFFPIHLEATGESYPLNFFVAIEGEKKEIESPIIEQWLLRDPKKFKRARLRLSRIDDYNERRTWQKFIRTPRKSA